jgi:hypothetical protein
MSDITEYERLLWALNPPRVHNGRNLSWALWLPVGDSCLVSAWVVQITNNTPVCLWRLKHWKQWYDDVNQRYEDEDEDATWY